jgi:predicted Zn-dependent protease
MFCPDTLDELDGKKKCFCDACRKQIEQKLMPQIDQI